MGKNNCCLKIFVILLALASIPIGAFGVYRAQAATVEGKSRSSVSVETIINGEVVQSIKEEKVNGETIERIEEFSDPSRGIEIKTEVKLKTSEQIGSIDKAAPLQVKAVNYERGSISRRIASERDETLFGFFANLFNYVLAFFKT